MISQFQLSDPLWLLLPVVVFILLIFMRLFFTGKVYFQLPDVLSSWQRSYYHPKAKLIAQLLKAQVSGLKKTRLSHKLLLWLGICFLSLALARPEWIREQWQQPVSYRDIVFVVDTSVSMLQRDYLANDQRVDRMTLLKGVLNRFITRLPDDNVSIIVYADEAYTLFPLTQDHDFARAMLARIKTGLAGRSSALGNAIARAIHEIEQSTSQQRMLILFTDATRLTGNIDISVATEMARQSGIRIYTVAIGARSSEAAEETYAGLIYAPADIDRLQAIANHTNGRFYWAGDTKTLNNAIQDINKLEAQVERVKTIKISEPLYQWPLLFAVLCLTALQLSRFRKQAA
jgi:Ca-activated chloride channel family protein